MSHNRQFLFLKRMLQCIQSSDRPYPTEILSMDCSKVIRALCSTPGHPTLNAEHSPAPHQQIPFALQPSCSHCSLHCKASLTKRGLICQFRVGKVQKTHTDCSYWSNPETKPIPDNLCAPKAETLPRTTTWTFHSAFKLQLSTTGSFFLENF